MSPWATAYIILLTKNCFKATQATQIQNHEINPKSRNTFWVNNNCYGDEYYCSFGRFSIAVSLPRAADLDIHSLAFLTSFLMP